MPKRGVLALVITAGALVLLLNFKTPEAAANPAGRLGGQAVISSPAAAQTQTGSSAAAGATTATSGGSTTATTAGATATAAGSTTTASKQSGTLTGTAVDTPFGPLQVQVTLSGGKITAVQALQYPSFHQRSIAINQYAIPQLVQETLQAQSAQVNAISGATYTSEAYMQSLQSALDQAHG